MSKLLKLFVSERTTISDNNIKSAENHSFSSTDIRLQATGKKGWRHLLMSIHYILKTVRS